MTAAGPLQLCAGHQSGCEAAVHAMRKLFNDPETEAIILVDATNAFNSLNRQNALRNIHHLCPSLSKTLINTYREDINLYIDGETLLSQEGTTQSQRDPLAMAMYAVAVNPLVNNLKQDTMKQVWFADDASAVGNLSDLRAWWDRLTNVGPDYGYFPNAAKTWLIVKDGLVEKAKVTFQGTDVITTDEGKRYLGSAIGKRSFLETCVEQKVDTWVEELKRLSSIAISQPHAAFAALTHGLSSRWTYLARTTPNIEELTKLLEETIRRIFIQNLTGQNATNDQERQLLALPARLGGLGISNPSKRSTLHYSTCETIAGPLVSLILDQSEVVGPEVKRDQVRMKTNAQKFCKKWKRKLQVT